MIFETAANDVDVMEIGSQPKLVTAFRAGLAGPVGYIEGCS
ncbi:hypothetical protein [Parasphingorhabdus sp.]